MRAPEFWSRPPGILATLLAPAGGAWQAAAELRRIVARPYRAPIPVLCVGNLVAGGAGKTPVVLSLAALLAEYGIAAHLVTRGYRGRLRGPVRVEPERHDAAAVGDEALVIAARAPCWVGHDRAAAIRAAAAAGAEAAILDDGFQNPTVAKDQSLLVVDAGYGLGNGRVIPAGPLREPARAALARCGAVVLLHTPGAPGHPRESGGPGAGDEASGLDSRFRGNDGWGDSCLRGNDGSGLPELPVPTLQAGIRTIDGARFAGRRIVAFAGIGRPEKFFATLRSLDAIVVGAHPFADHHPFRASEIAGLRRRAAEAGAKLVTTAKDFVRLPPDLRDGIAVLEIEVCWRDPAALAGLMAPFVLSARRDGRGSTHPRR